MACAQQSECMVPLPVLDGQQWTQMDAKPPRDRRGGVAGEQA